MHFVTILFGIGCAAGLILAAFSRDHDRMLMSVELAVAWAAANVLWSMDMLGYMCILDWLIGVQAIVIAHVSNAKWIRLFVALIALRLTLHVVDYLTGHAALVAYIHGLNATFVALLMVVSHGGAGNARDHLLGLLRRLNDRIGAPIFSAQASKQVDR